MEREKRSCGERFYINEPGRLPCSAVLPVLRLPIFNFLDINNKSEPLSDWIKVRIILFWWRLPDSNQWSHACEYPMVMIFAAFRTHLRLLTGILLSGIIIGSVISAPDFPPVGQNVGQNRAVAQTLHPQTIFLTKQVVCLFTVQRIEKR